MSRQTSVSRSIPGVIFALVVVVVIARMVVTTATRGTGAAARAADIPATTEADRAFSPPIPPVRASAVREPTPNLAEPGEERSRTVDGAQRAISSGVQDFLGVWRDKDDNCLDIEADRSGRVLYANFRPCTADSHVVSVGLYLVGASLHFVGDDREQLALLSDGTLQGSLETIPARERVGSPGLLRFQREAVVVGKPVGDAVTNNARNDEPVLLEPTTDASTTDDRSGIDVSDTPGSATVGTNSGATPQLAAARASVPARDAARSGDAESSPSSGTRPVSGVLTAIDIST